MRLPYTLRRAVFYLIALWAAITLNFLLPHLMPGNPATTLLANFEGRISPTALQSFMKAFGIAPHASLVGEYWQYLGQVIHLNFGLSYAFFPTPVASVLAITLPWTLALVGGTTVVSFLVGTYLGIVTAWKRGGFWDNVLPTGLTFVHAFPYFVSAYILVYVFAFLLGWFPIGGGYSGSVINFSWPFIASALHHAVLPALTILGASLGGWMLHMRNNMMSVLGSDYVLMAEAKGLPDRQVMWRYAVRNAMLPSLTGFALALGFVVAGAVLTEVVFNYPGVGSTLLRAVQSEDYPLAQGILLIISTLVLLANFVADLLYGLLDPRIRTAR